MMFDTNFIQFEEGVCGGGLDDFTPINLGAMY